MTLTDLVPFSTDDLMAPSSDAWRLIRGHFAWIIPNVLFALLPWLLAVLLFRREHRPTPLWWIGVAAFVLWLPYTAYMLTDLFHLGEAVGRSPEPALAVAVFVPTFTLYLTIGFVSYADSVRRARRHAFALSGGRLSTRWIDGSLAALVVFGILIGRVTRFHVWQLASAPLEVVRESVEALASPQALLFCVAMTAGLYLTARSDRPMWPAAVESRVTRWRRSVRSAPTPVAP
jgi:uncharacterized membrane protein